MEHLPEIKDPAYPLPQIPYLGHIVQYDGNGFFDFPQRHGWNLYRPLKRGIGAVRWHGEGPRHEKPELETPENIAALVQAWLFFGVLHEIFNSVVGLPVPLEEFIELRGGEMFVTTARLRWHLSRWEEHGVHANGDHFFGRKLLSSSHIMDLQTRAKKVLSVVERFYIQYLDRGARLPWAQCITLDLQLAILILSGTLKATGLYLWTIHKPTESKNPTWHPLVNGPDETLTALPSYHAQQPLELQPLLQAHLGHPSELLKERFLELGWCPNEYEMLSISLLHDAAGLFSASRMRRPFSSRNLSHAGCNSDRCVANLVKLGEYSTKHTAKCGGSPNCISLGFDSGHLAQQIEEGRVPLIDLCHIDCRWKDGRPQWSKSEFEDIDGPLPFQERLGLREGNAGCYIALSHVWSHGLGNEASNTLPLCQLRRLKAVAIHMQTKELLPQEPAIWIDTLCVPVDPKYQSSRRKAISGIVDVFRNARAVVVIDADLQEASGLADRTEVCLRLLCSGWMRRLWTLAEAVSSDGTLSCSRLRVMFADGPFEYNSLIRRESFVTYSLEAAYHSLIVRLPQSLHRKELFASLARALEYRSTSWLEDEAICLAAISGVDIKQIVQHRTAEQRMKEWYLLLTEIPLPIVFHGSPRLEIDGYRWAPRSLLTAVQSRVVFSPGGKHIGSDAVKRMVSVTANGVVLDMVEALLVRDLKSSPKIAWTGVGYYGASTTDTSDHVWLLAAALDDPDALDEEHQILVPEDKPLVVVRNPFVEQDAILVSVSREEDDVMYCQYLMKASLMRLTEENQNLQHYAEWDEECGHDTRINFEHMPKNKKWCIG